MAIVTRVHGDTGGVVNVDNVTGYQSNASIISTGIGKHPYAIKITGDSFTQLYFGDPTSSTTQMCTGGAVETILRIFEQAGTPLAYQVDGSNLSLLAESYGWGNTYAAEVAGNTAAQIAGIQDAALQTAITALGNVAYSATPPTTAYNYANVVVSSVNGMKFV